MNNQVQECGGHPCDDVGQYGAYWGSFVIRFKRDWPGRRFTMTKGETLVLHKRQVDRAKAGGELTYDHATILPEYYDLVAHFPAISE